MPLTRPSPDGASHGSAEGKSAHRGARGVATPRRCVLTEIACEPKRGRKLFDQEFYRCPPYDLVRAVPVLVAANIEPRVVLIRRAILADVRVAPDLHNGSEPKSGRTC